MLRKGVVVGKGIRDTEVRASMSRWTVRKEEGEMLTFLHVFIVGGWEGVEGHSEAGVDAVHGAGFAAQEFKCVWVLHDIDKHMSYALRRLFQLAGGRGIECSPRGGMCYSHDIREAHLLLRH